MLYPSLDKIWKKVIIASSRMSEVLQKISFTAQNDHLFFLSSMPNPPIAISSHTQPKQLPLAG